MNILFISGKFDKFNSHIRRAALSRPPNENLQHD